MSCPHKDLKGTECMECGENVAESLISAAEESGEK